MDRDADQQDRHQHVGDGGRRADSDVRASVAGRRSTAAAHQPWPKPGNRRTTGRRGPCSLSHKTAIVHPSWTRSMDLAGSGASVWCDGTTVDRPCPQRNQRPTRLPPPASDRAYRPTDGQLGSVTPSRPPRSAATTLTNRGALRPTAAARNFFRAKGRSATRLTA